MTKTDQENWEKMFRIMNNPDASNGTKEAMLKATFLPPVRVEDDIRTLERRIEEACIGFHNSEERKEPNELIMSSETMWEFGRMFEARYLSRVKPNKKVELSTFRSMGFKLNVIKDESLRLGQIKVQRKDEGITDCPFTSCALNTGNGGCFSTNTKQCKSIPSQFDEDRC